MPATCSGSSPDRDPLLASIGIAYIDPWVLVVDKPHGLLCQPGLGPALQDSVLLRLQRRWPDVQLVHRLDRDTSGLLLLARDSDSHRQLSRAFADRQVEKQYCARVLGLLDAAEGTIEAPIRKLSHRPPLYGVGEGGRSSLTHWQRLERHPHGSAVRLRPITGRSHQLRVHLQAIGHPILGDPLYGQPLAAGLCSRLCLHASGLAFRHPGSGDWLSLQSPARFPTQPGPNPADVDSADVDPADVDPAGSGAEGLAR